MIFIKQNYKGKVDGFLQLYTFYKLLVTKLDFKN